MAKVQTKDVVGLDQTLQNKIDTNVLLEADGVIKIDKIPDTFETDALIDTGNLGTTGLPIYVLNPDEPLIASKLSSQDIFNDQGLVQQQLIPNVYSTDALIDTKLIDTINNLPIYDLNPQNKILFNKANRSDPTLDLIRSASPPAVGNIYFRTTDNKIGIKVGTSWLYFTSSSSESILNNLLSRSHNFTLAPFTWNNTYVQIVYGSVNNGNVFAPDGTDDITLVTQTGQYDGLVFPAGNLLLSANTQYTWYVDIKAGTATDVLFALQSGNNVYVNTMFNTSTGVITSASFSGASIVSLGLGWYRLTHVFTTSATDLDITFYIRKNNNNVETFYLWRTQINTGNIASTYQVKP